MAASASLAPAPIYAGAVRAGARLGAGTSRPGDREPVGAVWSAALMLDHFEEHEAAGS